MTYEGTGTIQEVEDDMGDSIVPARASAEPGGEVEGFSEDFSQMLRAHFREKLKMKKAITNGHVVTFSFVISLSTPLSADRLVELEAKAAKKKNQGGIQGPVDPSVAIAHIHTEYAIFPGDTPLKTDVIFYATAARIFPDRHEPKTVRTWWADGQLWCSWTHSHTVHVTDALLRRIANHAIELRIWDSREKLSQRARLDRPRGFRPSELEGTPPSGMGYSMTSMLGIAGGVVITQAKLFTQEQSRQVLSTRPFTQTIRKHAHKSDQTSHVGGGGGTGRTVSPTPTESKSSDIQGAKVIPELGNQLRDYSQIARTANASADFEEVTRRKRLAAAYRHGQAANAAMLRQGSISSEKQQDNATKQGGSIHSLAKRLRPSPNIPSDAGSHLDVSNNSDISNMRGIGTDIRSSIASVATTTGNLPSNLPVSSGIMQSIRLRVATLYDGRKSTTCRILQPAGLISDCLMTVIVDPSLLSEQQMIKFKPVMVRIVSAGPLPPGFTPGNSVFCRCLLPDLSPTPLDAVDPKSVQIRAVDEILNKEKVAQQQQQEAELVSLTELMQALNNNSVYWNHSIVLLTGDIPDDALRQNLLQRPLIVELHDREALPAANPANQPQSLSSSTTTVNSTVPPAAPAMKPAVFGTLPNDSQIASTAVLPPPPPEPPKPPYGLAEISLYDLLVSPTGKGITFSQGTSVVRPKRPPPPTNSPSSESTVKKIPLPRYLEHGTITKVTARAPIPLFTTIIPKTAETAPPTRSKTAKSTSSVASSKSTPVTPEPVLMPSQCILTLIIIVPMSVIPQENSDGRIDNILAEMMRTTAIDTNSESLSLAALVGPEERSAALTAYQLAPAQQIDKTLNLVTGFHLVDEDGVLLVVEGFGEVISPLWDDVMDHVHNFESSNRVDGKITILYNSSLSSPTRRYGGLDLSFGVITLGRGISKIVAEPLLYIRDMAPAACCAAAVKLAELRANATSLADIFRRGLLPTSQELRSLNDEFAVKVPTQSPQALKPETSLFVTKEATQVEPNEENYSSDNEETVRRIRDFMRENVEVVWQQSEQNRLKREQTETLSVAVNTGHIYSSHSVNAVEIAKAHIRDHMLSPDRRYSFCQFYHNRTMTPRSASPERFSMYPHAREWQYPGHVDAIQANIHPSMPDPARREEISQPWRENWLHEKYLNPPLERGPFTWDRRRTDLHLYEVPEKETKPSSIFKAGDATEFPLECLPPRTDRRLRVYRRGISSELAEFSTKLSLLDRVADVLHDPPTKLSLQFQPVREIPKISMLADDPPMRNEKCKPFGPIHYNDWLLNRNIIPLKSSTFEV